MLADLVVVGGVLAVAAATFAWLALVPFGLSRADQARSLPPGVWVLLCLFSPVCAVVYLVASRAWRHRPRHRAGRRLA